MIDMTDFFVTMSHFQPVFKMLKMLQKCSALAY